LGVGGWIADVGCPRSFVLWRAAASGTAHPHAGASGYAKQSR
jgi:hypothetical protein